VARNGTARIRQASIWLLRDDSFNWLGEEPAGQVELEATTDGHTAGQVPQTLPVVGGGAVENAAVGHVHTGRQCGYRRDMALTRRIARPLLASIFIVGGLDALRDPGSKTKKARAVTEPLNEHIPPASNVDTETMVRINAGIQVGAGVLLAVGRFRRLACLALMGSIVPTTYAGHRFWEETDDATRAQQRTHFVKNLGLLGGLILAAVDTEGAPSLSWRARRRLQAVEISRGPNHSEGVSHDLASKTKTAAAGVSGAVAAASRSGTKAAKRARRTGRQAHRRMKDVGSDIGLLRFQWGRVEVIRGGRMGLGQVTPPA
jgi:uncharacterized membrane protein YphA (DoxX/SURF4 family)